MSIYRASPGPQPGSSALKLARVLGVVLLELGAGTVLSAKPARPCSTSEAPAPYLRERVSTLGTTPARIPLDLPPGREWMIEIREHANDATVEVRDAAGRLLAQADHPERRTGTRRIIVTPSHGDSLTLSVAGKEHAAVNGTAEVLVFDLATLSSDRDCLGAYRSLAAADADYATAQQISLGRSSGGPHTAAAPSARATYLRAAEEYASAEALLQHPTDAALHGEVALALAGVRYFDLQDWRGSAESAETAATLLRDRDPYRRARAQAIVAAAWIEMASNAAQQPASGTAFDPQELFHKARRTLRALFAFHDRRHELYDAALQINNIGVAYSYEGQFRECISAARTASRMFAQLGEAPRRALAWQNQALCHWGLGHLPQALDAFNKALEDLKPDPYPKLYLLTLNNTALVNFALGHLDESLRLHDRSLELAIRVQNPLQEAQSLYGIGVTYYALGDRPQAQEFLERSLAIRTAALDGRGRRATLRALATVYADHGDYAKAVELDREALTLATAPTPRARTSVQLAVHMALAGQSDDALKMLAQLIASGGINDPLILAEARLERAAIERRGGNYQTARDDLSVAIPIFRRFGSVTDGFNADLERARVLELTGHPAAALEVVDHALQRSEDIRTQTANPELRAQLQLPLRPAYDLKLDLLWDEFNAATQTGDERAAARIANIAFQTADAARARSFTDLAAQRYPPELAQELGRRETLYRSIAGMRFALEARLDRMGSSDSRVKRYASELASLRRQVDIVNNAIAARATARRRPAPSMMSGPMSASLPADTAIIAYWIGSDAAYGWALTPRGCHWLRLEGPAVLTDAARTFHDSLDRLVDVSREQRVAASVSLYGEIIRPIEAWIAPYRRWIFIPDAALDYVPYAALRGGVQAGTPYVVSQHDIGLTPAAWRLRAPRPSGVRPDGRLLLVSDPVYELRDPRLNRPRAPQDPGNNPADPVSATPDGMYKRIPGTAREAAAIAAEFPATQVDALDGLQATRERLLQLDWSRYRFIHIATHGHVDAGMPQLSSLLLSTYDEHGTPIEAALRTADLSSLTLNADVAVFSGCNSALGKEVLNEGLVGISYAALARGAGAVISSLWQVPDEISARLMTELYGHLLRDSMSPISALSASMRSLVDRNPSADPALWAAFQVSVISLAEPSH